MAGRRVSGACLHEKSHLVVRWLLLLGGGWLPLQRGVSTVSDTHWDTATS